MYHATKLLRAPPSGSPVRRFGWLAGGVLSVCVLAGCVAPTVEPEVDPATLAGERTVRSPDGHVTGVVVGPVGPNSRFARVRIGMALGQVQTLIGPPDAWQVRETGKRWLPFYYGNDMRRLQAFWQGEGCLSFATGTIRGERFRADGARTDSGNELVRIEVDPAGGCYPSEGTPRRETEAAGGPAAVDDVTP